MKRITKILFSIAFVIIGLGIGNSINGQVIISEVYGGGGNANATFTNDFVELYNQGATAVNLSTYTIWYSSATGTFNSSVALTGTIPANGYYLIQLGSGGATGAALPNPNQTGNINLSATNGNVLLTTATLTTGFTCATATANTVDRLGYGTGNCPETTAAPAGSNTTSVSRTNPVPAADTDNNSVDFTAGAPTPASSSLTPTASAGTVSGKVGLANGRGIKHVVIMISGGGLEEPLYATTNQFGRYQFEDIPVGDSYVLSVFSKRYNFDQTSKVINLSSSLTDVDFVTAPSGSRTFRIQNFK